MSFHISPTQSDEAFVLRTELDRIHNSRTWKILSLYKQYESFFRPLIAIFLALPLAKRILRKGVNKCDRLLDKLVRKAHRMSAAFTDDLPRLYPKQRDFAVLYVIGCMDGQSKRYRVHNPEEYLEEAGIRTAHVEQSVANTLSSYELRKYDVVVFFRTAWTQELEAFIERVKKVGSITVFDIDDYVFDEQVMQHVDAIQDWSVEQKAEYLHGVQRYKRALQLCDAFMGSTTYLTQQAKRLFPNKPAYTLRNALNALQVQTASQIPAKRIRKQILIGYLSGTKTHRADFAVAVPSLVRILKEFPQVSVVLVGDLDVPDALEPFQKRIIRKPLQSPLDLLKITAELDITLAPLERGNPYCESKSNLKYFESALVKVPTVATATVPFAEGIQDGETGFLAYKNDDFYEKLKMLIEDERLRLDIGKKAYKSALEMYGPDTLAHDTRELFKKVIEEYRERELNLSPRQLRINCVISEPILGGGGHRNIFRICNFLAQQGHSVCIICENYGMFRNAEQLRAFICQNFYDFPMDVVLGVEGLPPADAAVATFWTTVYDILPFKERQGELFYLVQDYEPFFYPMGSKAIAATNTYKLGFSMITSGVWCKEIIKKMHGVDCLGSFNFPLDSRTYYPRGTKRSEEMVAFFAKPEMDRRCFSLGIEALAIVKQHKPSVEIVLFGSANIRHQHIPFSYTDKGILPTLNDLAELYSRATVGMVFSTTNPSLVPFEMMACGCPVVDLDMNSNVVQYGGRDNVQLVDTTPTSIAEGILELLEEKSARENMAKRGQEFITRTLVSEEETGKNIITLIEEQYWQKENGT